MPNVTVLKGGSRADSMLGLDGDDVGFNLFFCNVDGIEIHNFASLRQQQKTTFNVTEKKGLLNVV